MTRRLSIGICVAAGLLSGCGDGGWSSVLARPAIVGSIAEIDTSGGQLRLLVSEHAPAFGVAEPSGQMMLVTVSDRSVLLILSDGILEPTTVAELRLGRRVSVASEFVVTTEVPQGHGDTVVVRG